MEKELLQVEKLIKKLIRKVFRNSSLEYTVQVSVSSVDPGKVKYSALIQSPTRHIQEIPFVFESLDDLKKAVEKATKDFSFEDITKAEVESRINVYKNKAKQLEDYLKEINEHGLDEDGFLKK